MTIPLSLPPLLYPLPSLTLPHNPAISSFVWFPSPFLCNVVLIPTYDISPLSHIYQLVFINCVTLISIAQQLEYFGGSASRSEDGLGHACFALKL